MENPTIDMVVDIHPRRIRTPAEAEGVISKIRQVEAMYGCEAGVVIMQNRQLGASHEVVLRDEAMEKIRRPRVCEWGVDYLPRSYFEELRDRLNGEAHQEHRQSPP